MGEDQETQGLPCTRTPNSGRSDLPGGHVHPVSGTNASSHPAPNALPVSFQDNIFSTLF